MALPVWFRELGIRWLIIVGTLLLTLSPGLLYVSFVPQLARLPRLMNPALIWLIMATAPGGFTRIGERGTAYFAGSGWIFALIFWTLTGLGLAAGLRRLSRGWVAWLALPLVLAAGFAAHYLLRAIGFAAYVDV
jgi:hypothetical protein